MQSCCFIGYTGSDPQMRFTGTGKPVVNLPLAVKCGYGDHEQTLWLTVTCWDKLAQTVNEHVIKGQQIAVIGELSPAEMYDKDGQVRIRQTFTASRVEFLGRKGTVETSETEVEDIPFR